jgi:hypothetical protein
MAWKSGLATDSPCGDTLFSIAYLNFGADEFSQDAGHHQATVYKAARSLSRSYGSAWMRQYVLLLPTMYTINLTHFPAGQKPEEEQHQLPPLENVPQDRGASQAELDTTTTLLSLCTLCIPMQRQTYEIASRKELGLLWVMVWRFGGMTFVYR